MKIVIDLLGHILQLTGIFFAFLATGLAFVIANIMRGGATGKASFYMAIGFAILALDIFGIYTGAITGKLDLLNITLYWHLLGLLTLLGFGIIVYAQWEMIKVMR